MIEQLHPAPPSHRWSSLDVPLLPFPLVHRRLDYMAVLALERLVDVQEGLHGVLARRHIVQAGASIARTAGVDASGPGALCARSRPRCAKITAMSTVADLIVRRFVEAGVRGLFGMPGGGSNLDLLEAAARADVPFVLSHTETAGALMACAQAEITRAPGACLATLGPGVASLANGVAHARLDRVPLVVVTDGLPVAVRRTYDHQALDHAAFLAPLVKRSVLVEPRDDGHAAAAAIAAALAPPPGPVHLDCPSDVAPGRPRRDAAHGPAAATRATATGAAAHLPAPLLAGSRRPLVIAGLGIGTASEAARLRALCERRGMPALVTYKAKGVVPDTHPSFAGVFTHAALEEPFVRSADLIVAVGLDPVELLPRPWTYPQPVVACGPWPNDGRHVPVAAQATGDLDDLVAALDERLRADTAWSASEIRRQADGQREALRIEAAGFAPYRAVEAAARAAGPGARVTVDAGAHMFPIVALWPVSEPRQMLISNGLSTMGYALPAAIGAALLDRPRRSRGRPRGRGSRPARASRPCQARRRRCGAPAAPV